MTTLFSQQIGFIGHEQTSMEENQIVGRISAHAQNIYKVLTDKGELYAKISGKFLYNANSTVDYPVIGDFVILEVPADIKDNAIIHQILPRKTCLARQSAGNSIDEQVIASNIDRIFICMSLNEDYNLRRLERYLAISWESGALPYIILTKTDLCTNLDTKIAEISAIALGVEIICTTNSTIDGYADIENYLEQGKTAAFIGSSGVGKSTLINHFIQGSHITTDGLRNDDKGRHTTTQRNLYVLPNDLGIVIDTPGMRELGVGHVSLATSFNDIGSLAVQCKFTNCQHETEPKCAIKRAIENGDLSRERFESYQKLQLESEYDGMNSRTIEETKVKRMVGSKKAMKKIVHRHQH